MLLAPLDIAGSTAKNRLVFGPHETNLAEGRAIADAHVAYYGRRALGGAGIVVTETASVHPLTGPTSGRRWPSECSTGWARPPPPSDAGAMRDRLARPRRGSRAPPPTPSEALWAPSPVPDSRRPRGPKEMEADDIAACRRLRRRRPRASLARPGWTASRSTPGSSACVRQFLSGLTNQRGDDGSRRGQRPTAFARGPRPGFAPRWGGVVGLAAVVRRAGAVGGHHAGAGRRHRRADSPTRRLPRRRAGLDLLR